MRRPAPAPINGIDGIAVPTCIEQANDTLQQLAETSRRSFLGRGLAATAIPAAIVGASSAVEAQTTSGSGPFPSYYAGSTLRNFQEIQSDEFSHVNIIVAAIQSLGGTPRPYPTFRGIDISNPTTFLNLSVIFENTGVGAYFGATPSISNKNVLGVAASIAFVEAYHSGFLNTLANLPIVPGGPQITYARPLTQQQVVAALTPFIVSLNDPNNQFPAAFSETNLGLQNDIAILNFALIAEYLEATFYFNSVSKVFARSR